MEIRVTTQEELDEALARPGLTYSNDELILDSPRDVWLELSDSKGLDVRAYDSSTVWASGSARVQAYDSSTVWACDSSTVWACDSASVEACDSASVEACDSASVRAYGSASVRAYDSASVRAYDSASVRAYDSASVEAGRWVAVHLHSKDATLTGGVLIDMTQLDCSDPTTWCHLMGVEVDGEGGAHLYKAVDNELYAGHSHVKTQYPIGGDPECDVWGDNNECGSGLHACPTPGMALDHYRNATRFLEVTAPLDSIRPIDETKAKARTVHVLREVDLNGRPVEVEK